MLRAILVAVLVSPFLFAERVLAEALFPVPAEVRSYDGDILDFEALRSRISNLDLHRDDAELSRLIATTSIKFEIEKQLIDACGNEAALREFSDKHGFLHYELTKSEKALYAKCLDGVYAFADAEFNFDGPGFYRRFDQAYLDEATKLGYRCGYRSQKLLSYFALATWLHHVADIEKIKWFRCIGDVTSEYVNSEHGLLFGIGRIVKETTGVYSVFQNWEDAQKYRIYRGLVRENLRLMTCESIMHEHKILMDKHDEELDFIIDLLLENSCIEDVRLD